MTDEMHEILKRTYCGGSVIRHINKLEDQLDVQTKGRLTAEDCLQDALEENTQLKEKLDNVKRQSHE